MFLAILSLAAPLAGGANPPGRVLPGSGIVAEPGTVTVDERREVAERRAAVEARVEELRQRLVAPCGNLHDVVRSVLGSVERVGAVESGPALLTSHPPKLRVSYAVALTSGRQVYDEVVVEVPFDVRIVPAADRAPVHRCGRAAPGR